MQDHRLIDRMLSKFWLYCGRLRLCYVCDGCFFSVIGVYWSVCFNARNKYVGDINLD